MIRDEVINLLGLSGLDDILIDNIFQLNDLYPDFTGYYNTEKSCNVYAYAAQLYRMYLPDFMVSKMLNTPISDLIDMNIECIPTPVEYQSIFYDKYDKGRFHYSKYLFRTSDVLIVTQMYSKEIFLEMLPDIVEMYPKKFFSLEDSGRILGMSRIKSAMYHYYFMSLNIRFAYFNGLRKYFQDDIAKVLEYAEDFFDNHYSDYELTQKYSYACYDFMRDRIKHPSIIDNIYYDVVLSDYRFPNGFQQSYKFYKKDSVQEAYRSWFSNYNRMICKVQSPELDDLELYKEVSSDIYDYYLVDQYTGVIISKVYDIAPIYKEQSVLEHLGMIEHTDDYSYKNYEVSKDIIYFIFGINEESQKDFDLAMGKLLGERPIHYYGSIITNVFIRYRQYMFETMYNKYSNRTINIKWSYLLNIFDKTKEFNILGMKVDTDDTNPYEWFKELLYYIPDNPQDSSNYYALRKQSWTEYYRFNIKEKIINKLIWKHYVYDLPTNKINDMYDNKVTEILRLLQRYNGRYDKYVVSPLKQSSLETMDTLPADRDLFSLKETISYLKAEYYPFTLLWLILWNSGLKIVFYNCRLFFFSNELIDLNNKLTQFVTDHMPFNQLSDITHGKTGYIREDYKIMIINWAYAYLISLENPCYVYCKGLSELYLENVINYPYACEVLLTEAEAKGNLNLLPRQIPGTLTNVLLNIDNKVYTENHRDYYNKNKVFAMMEQLNEFKQNYVPLDKIREFLQLHTDHFTKNDLKLLETVQAVTIPWSVSNSKDWFDANSKSTYAYKKTDLYALRDYFHCEHEKKIDFRHVYYTGEEYRATWYETYKFRFINAMTHCDIDTDVEFFPIWDEYIKIRLATENGSQKTTDNKILQYIRAYYILYFVSNEKNLQSIRNLTTNDINELFDGRIPQTYCRILLGFFHYASNVYNSRLEQVLFRVREIKIPRKKNLSFSDTLPQIYSFEEYSQVFDYCNNYQKHIKKAVDEILVYKTCIYASTWFYIMSHMNNAWRSSDFTHFPNINVEKVILRNLKQEGYSWFLSNSLSKSEAMIIALELQNHPKVISKTRKYTVFMCSDELLITYATVYLLLSYYTRYLTYDRDIVCHFFNQYNCLNKKLLNNFFDGMHQQNFEFKSKKMNKTLMTMIDFLEEYYIGNDYDQMRREAMLLRSHVNPETTMHYIRKNKEIFERLTNMLCVRGEFGYIYEYLINAASRKELPANVEEKTDKIRELRNYIPDIADAESIFSFMNFTKKEKNAFTQYVNSLSIVELQKKIVELYLRRNPSKMSIKIPCINSNCTNYETSDATSCAFCIFHIPTVYSLVTICKSIKEDIKEYSALIKEQRSCKVMKTRLMRRIIKKSVDIITAKKIYGDEILEEIFDISGLHYNAFMDMIREFNENTQGLIEQTGGE